MAATAACSAAAVNLILAVAGKQGCAAARNHQRATRRRRDAEKQIALVGAEGFEPPTLSV